MFFYDPQDTSNSVAIKPLTPLELKIIKVIDKDSKSVTSINANEEYTYIASQKGNDITQLKWCFWIDKRDDDFDKEYTIEITATADKADMESDFFLTSKVEGNEDKKKENTKLLKENAILSATITTETHDIGGKQQEVAVLKVKYSKWLDGEKIRVEIYKYNDKNKKPTRNSSKDAVCSRTVIAKPEVAEVYWMAADGEKLEETGYSEDIYLYIKTLGLKDKTLELNIYDDDITPKPIVMENEDDYVAWSGNKIKVEERDSIKQFKVGSKERYENARKDEIEDEKPKENDFLQVNFDFNKINDSGQKQDPEILELYVAVNNATDLKLNSITYQTKFGKLKLTPKEQVVDAFFAKPKKESVIADLPLGKDKNKQDTNKKTEVNHYEKLEKGVIGQKITLVAECDNLEGKDVAIYIYEKKPLLEAKDTKLKVIQNDKEIEKVCATVKDGYAVAEIQLQKPDSAKYKAWDRKLDPDTGDEKSSELYLKVVVEGIDSPATNKAFLKEGKEKFELFSDVIRYDIYDSGKIDKYIREHATKVRYNYFEGETKHRIGRVTFVEGKWIFKDYIYTKKKLQMLDIRDLRSYSNGNIKFNFLTINVSSKHSRFYIDIDAYAAMIAAMIEEEIEDLGYNGFSSKNGGSGASSSHWNGMTGDLRYLSTNKNGETTYLQHTHFDYERQIRFNNALYKFGFSKYYSPTRRKTITMYSENFNRQTIEKILNPKTKKMEQKVVVSKNTSLLPHTEHYRTEKAQHYHHLHVQGFDPSYINEIK
ncbi:hypothetical protein [Bernardetia sp. MNP-M8]|uniref:hypothetical protein n=1 Tax=Bernardetia sp. MNP-M8 TaxID=3127470 RepID=UPI0030D2FD5E